MNMVDKVAEAIANQMAADENDNPSLARAALAAMREPEDDVLAAGYEAMFDDKWDGSQAPMMGAAWDAMIEAAQGTEARRAETGNED